MKLRQGFTLIELLTVIAIISVLATLLLPALQAAKMAGNTARCQSNLRQVGIAIASYRADFNEYIPKRLPTFSPMTAGSVSNWLHGTAVAGAPHDEATDSLRDYILDPRILECPSSIDFEELSYGVNGRIVEVVSNYNKIKSPSEAPMSFDSWRTVSYYFSDINFRHGADANALYADGHVEPKYLDVLFRTTGAVPLPGPNGQDHSNPVDNTALYGGTFTLRVAGSKWDTVYFTLYEDSVEFGRTFIDRQPGDPDDQVVTMGPFWLDPVNRSYKIDMLMETEHAGGNPVWLIVNDGHQTRIATLNRNNFHEEVDITQLLRTELGL